MADDFERPVPIERLVQALDDGVPLDVAPGATVSTTPGLDLLRGKGRFQDLTRDGDCVSVHGVLLLGRAVPVGWKPCFTKSLFGHFADQALEWSP